MLAEGRIGVGEDHALLRQVLAERTVDDLALVLGLHAGKVLLFGLGNPQLVEGVLDLRRHVFPGLALVFGGLEIIVHVLEIDADLPTPQRHGLGIENIQALEAKLPHPLRLALHFRDLRDDLPVESLAGLEHVVLVVAEIVFIDFAQHILWAGFGIRCHQSAETPGRPVKAGGASLLSKGKDPKFEYRIPCFVVQPALAVTASAASSARTSGWAARTRS